MGVWGSVCFWAGYRLKSAAAHNQARRKRLERQRRDATEQLADLPPRVTTADIRHRSAREDRTSG
jgi:hypothetical protein